MSMEKLKCKVCGHEWWPRIEHIPIMCPNRQCQSSYWNTGYIKYSKKRTPNTNGSIKLTKPIDI